MELFTMGRGNYTENDVKEAARAFTGWAFNPKGEFIFRRNQHDDSSKTFLGKTGNFDGDDILNMLLENKQTANYIGKKIFRQWRISNARYFLSYLGTLLFRILTAAVIEAAQKIN